MRKGLSITELAQKIERESKGKVDMIADTRDMAIDVSFSEVTAEGQTPNAIVKLDVKPSGEEADEQALVPGRVTVISSSAEMGDNQSVLDASVSGEEQLVAFNGRYLRDALEHLDSPEVRLEITGPASPGLLRPLGATQESYLHVIMPMHVPK